MKRFGIRDYRDNLTTVSCLRFGLIEGSRLRRDSVAQIQGIRRGAGDQNMVVKDVSIEMETSRGRNPLRRAPRPRHRPLRALELVGVFLLSWRNDRQASITRVTSSSDRWGPMGRLR